MNKCSARIARAVGLIAMIGVANASLGDAPVAQIGQQAGPTPVSLQFSGRKISSPVDVEPHRLEMNENVFNALEEEGARRGHGNRSESIFSTQLLSIRTEAGQLKSFLGVTLGENVRQRKFSDFDKALRDAGKSPSDIPGYHLWKDSFIFRLPAQFLSARGGIARASANSGKIWLIGVIETFKNSKKISSPMVKDFYPEQLQFYAVRKRLVQELSRHPEAPFTEISKKSNQKAWETITKAWNGGISDVIDCRYFIFSNSEGNPSQCITLGLIDNGGGNLFLRFTAEDLAIEGAEEDSATLPEKTVCPQETTRQELASVDSTDSLLMKKMLVNERMDQIDESYRRGTSAPEDSKVLGIPVSEINNSMPAEERIRQIIQSVPANNDFVFPSDSRFASKWKNFEAKINGWGRQHNISDAYALIDTTVFGSCDEGILIDNLGITVRHDFSDANGFISWVEFASKGVIKDSGFDNLILCEQPKIEMHLSGSKFKRDQAKKLFTSLLSAVRR